MRSSIKPIAGIAIFDTGAEGSIAGQASVRGNLA